MPDVACWIDEWDGMPDMARVNIASRRHSEFSEALKPIVAEEMSVPEANDIIPPRKIDVLDVRPLVNSDSKKVVIHVHTHPTAGRLENMPRRLKAIAVRVRELLGLPEDEECVAVCFKRVEAGDWVKA